MKIIKGGNERNQKSLPLSSPSMSRLHLITLWIERTSDDAVVIVIYSTMLYTVYRRFKVI